MAKVLINADALVLERELNEIDDKISAATKRGRIGVNELVKLRAQRGITANALMRLLNQAKPEPRRYCAGCGASVTSADVENDNRCTQCGHELKG